MRESSRVLVDDEAPPSPETQLVSYESLREYLKGFAQGELFTDIGLDEVIVEHIPGQDDPGGPGRSPTGRVIRAIPEYELRYFELRFSHSGVIAKCTPRELAMSVRYQFNHALARLRTEQPNAQWRLIVAHVRQDSVNRQFDYTGNVETAPDFNLAELVNQAEQNAMRVGRGDAAQGVAMQNRTIMSKQAQQQDLRSLLCCVVVDIAKAEVLDPVNHRWPGEHGPMQRYTEQQELRYLPQNLRRERMVAKTLIERAIRHGQLIEEQAQEQQPALESNEATLRSMSLLREHGQEWAEIGKAFGCSWQTARSQVLRYNSGQDPAEGPPGGDDDDGLDD